MFNTHSDLPVHGDRAWGCSASTPKSWLAAAARRLSRRPAAPGAPAPRNPEREAEAVRALAFNYRVTDRGFAAELYAAAERHESASDDRSGTEVSLALTDGQKSRVVTVADARNC